MLGAYIVFRCMLLATMENADPRYTLEWFPILIVAAAVAVVANPATDTEKLPRCVYSASA
jgi:hypothetical protein